MAGLIESFTQSPSLSDRSVRNRLTDRSFKRLILAPTTKAIQPRGAITLSDANTDYIELPRNKSAKDKVAALEHEEGQDYRSLAGQVKPTDVNEEDEWDELEENDEDEAESFDDYLKRRNVEFDRHLHAHPNDTKSWLELVDFQDIVHNVISEDGTKASRKVQSQISRRSIAEIKLAILERALSQAGNEEATDLRLAMLKYGSDLWDTKELMKRWMELLRLKPEEMEVWLDYLTFRQTNATSFSVQEVVDVYADCLQRLAKFILRNPRGSRGETNLAQHLSCLITESCCSSSQAGRELSVSIPEGLPSAPSSG